MSTSVPESSASPIWPSSPDVRPAPNSINTVIPCAVELVKAEARTEMQVITATAAPSSKVAVKSRSGAKSPVIFVIRTVSRKTTTT